MSGMLLISLPKCFRSMLLLWKEQPGHRSEVRGQRSRLGEEGGVVVFRAEVWKSEQVEEEEAVDHQDGGQLHIETART